MRNFTLDVLIGKGMATPDNGKPDSNAVLPADPGPDEAGGARAWARDG
jgi:hypothetical protein